MQARAEGNTSRLGGIITVAGVDFPHSFIGVECTIIIK